MSVIPLITPRGMSGVPSGVVPCWLSPVFVFESVLCVVIFGYVRVCMFHVTAVHYGVLKRPVMSSDADASFVARGVL